MSLYTELKDRKVIRVAAVYLVVAWLIMQVVAVVSEPLLLPDWFARVVILLLTIGFPLAIILSWAFDATPAEGSDNRSGKPLAFGLIAATAIVIGFIVTGFNSGDSEPTAEVIISEESSVLPNSVAVLPLDNLSLDPEDAFFAAGIHDTILNALTNILDMNVIARTTMLGYANTDKSITQIANELNVETVLEGSVQYADDRVLVTIQLIDPETLSRLWSESYNRELADVFAIQADIAMNVANTLQAKFIPFGQGAELSISGDAVALYLKSLDLGLPEDQAILLLDQAIELDVDFAEAYAWRAFLLRDISSQTDEAEILAMQRRAINDADTALALDPQLSYAHAARALVFLAQGREEDARAAFDRGLASNPNDTEILDRYTQFSILTGEFTKAVQLAQYAVRLDPNNGALHDALGDALLTTNPEAAADSYRMAMVLGDTSPGLRLSLGWAEFMRGDAAEALAQFRITEVLNDGISDSFEGRPFFWLRLAYGYALIGRQDDADRLARTLRDLIASSGLVQFRNENWSYGWALLSLIERDSFEALANISSALENTENGLLGATEIRRTANIIKYNPLNDPILDQPEFVAVREKLGYTDL